MQPKPKTWDDLPDTYCDELAHYDRHIDGACGGILRCDFCQDEAWLDEDDHDE